MNSGIARGKFFTQRPSKKGDRDAKDTMVTSADMGTVPTYPKAEKVVSGAGSLNNPPVNIKTITPGSDILKGSTAVMFGGIPITFVVFNIGNMNLEIHHLNSVKYYSTTTPELLVVWLSKKDHSVVHTWRGQVVDFSADFEGMENDEGVFMIMLRRSYINNFIASPAATDLLNIWGIDDNMLINNGEHCQFAVSSRQRLDATGPQNSSVRAALHFGRAASGNAEPWYHSQVGCMLFGPTLIGANS